MNLQDETKLSELLMSDNESKRSLGRWMEGVLSDMEDGAANLEKERDEAMEEADDYSLRLTSAHDGLEVILFDPLADDIPTKLTEKLKKLLTDLGK